MTPKQKFSNYIAGIKDVKLRNCCRQIAKNYPDFFTFPASLGHHHAYEGGLLVHTNELGDISEHLLGGFPKANRDVVRGAIVWHDVCKIRDYQLQFLDVGELRQYKDKYKRRLIKKMHNGAIDGNASFYWLETPYKNCIHHIQGSFGEFTYHAKVCGVSQDLIDQIGTAILSHHGPVKEWGSNIRPQTLEATIVHMADYLSAAYGPTANSDFTKRP